MSNNQHSIMSKGWLIIGIVLILTGSYLVFITNSLYYESNQLARYPNDETENTIIGGFLLFSKKNISISVISDLDQLIKLKTIWNDIVSFYGLNPILFYNYVKKYLEYNQLSGWDPFILVNKINANVIGIAPG